MSCPVEASSALSGEHRGVLELVGENGSRWSRAEFTLEVTLRDAVALAGRLSDPSVATAGLRERLERVCAPYLAGEAKVTASSELAAYGQAVAALPAAARRVLSREVTAPVLRSIEQSSLPRKARKASSPSGSLPS